MSDGTNPTEACVTRPRSVRRKSAFRADLPVRPGAGPRPERHQECAVPRPARCRRGRSSEFDRERRSRSTQNRKSRTLLAAHSCCAAGRSGSQNRNVGTRSNEPEDCESRPLLSWGTRVREQPVRLTPEAAEAGPPSAQAVAPDVPRTDEFVARCPAVGPRSSGPLHLGLYFRPA